VSAGDANTQKLKPAHHRGGENAQRYRRAELQEGAGQGRSGMILKVGGDRLARFPWPGEMRPTGKADYKIKTRIEQQRVNDRDDSRIRPGMFGI
jgi:hypothetical protein